MREVCGAPTKTLPEGAKAAKDVDGMSERGGVTSRSPTEKIGFQWVPTARKKRG